MSARAPDNTRPVATPPRGEARPGHGRPPAAARPRRWRTALLGTAALLASVPQTAADTFIPLTSYETDESDLLLTPRASDAGLALAIVPGGTGGAPPASDGARLLRVTLAGEVDRKVEFTHRWDSSWYDLADKSELLIDVFVPSAADRPAVVGIFDNAWAPPDNWLPASNLPLTVGAWHTLTIPLLGRTQTDLTAIWALVLENFPGATATLYVDHLRFRRPGPPEAPGSVNANGYAHGNELLWRPARVAQFEGYHVYRSTTANGTYARLTGAPLAEPRYLDASGAGGPRYFYRVSQLVAGVESELSDFAFAQFNGLSDEQMLDLVQERTFDYFWTGAHPVCGLAREGIGFGHPPDTVTTGGSGFGLMTICVGVERGFVTRAAAAERVLTMLTFLEESVTRYHGAFAHHYHGVTGATIPFSEPADNGGDIVETAFLTQGILTARQYFDDPDDPVESELRARATAIWEAIDWAAYTRPEQPHVLMWNWSPEFGFQINVEVRGYNEALMAYLLAIASPTHPIPPASYEHGWAGLDAYTPAGVYFGHTLDAGRPLAGGLSLYQYSFMAFDPRYRRDAFANYAENNRRAALIHQAYATANPHGFRGYGPLFWGLTASSDPVGYFVHEPLNDNGTPTPTAALSSFPCTPVESMAALRHMYDTYGFSLWGPYGFYNALNPTLNWVGLGYLAIDQGPIVPMIENHRTGKPWRWFMSNPEIAAAQAAAGIFCEIDFDLDGDVDAADAAAFYDALQGPDVTLPPPGITGEQFALADLDGDGDVDMLDAAIAQTLAGPDL